EGIPHCLTAAEQARAVYARERAVTFLRMARDLARLAEPNLRAPILRELAIAETEALLLDDAGRSIDEALGTLALAGAEPTARAGTLQPFAWRTREETEAVSTLARTWQRPGAVMRALDVVARDCIYHHGAILEAVERLRDLLALSEHVGSIPGQAEALVQLAL